MEDEGTSSQTGMSAEHHNCNNHVVTDNPTMCGSCCVRKVGYPSGIRDETVEAAAAVGEGEENGNEGVNKIDGRNNQVWVGVAAAAAAAAIEVCEVCGADLDTDCAVDTGIDLNAALAVLGVSVVVDQARDRVLNAVLAVLGV